MRKQKGFTLIELLIVMGLTVILMAAVLGSISSSQYTMGFLDSNERVLSLIRNARTNAITGKAVTDYTDYDKDADTADQVTPANYGVYFTKTDATGPINKVILFADMHSDTPGEEGTFQQPAGTDYEPGKDLIINSFVIHSSLEIKLLSGPTNTVLFSPIFADTKLYPDPNIQYFWFKIYQPATKATKCYIIHPAAGNPEPFTCPITFSFT